ncbi:hypothetical protein HMPREF0083_00590 [Aneurinibacillus aneurinilyticus ATCC 12856]|uniref:Uncharacterized protein n=1 Tax=Aneurinibacillus aneurinilyticus ATCC 12856 TaxID=649747 RepID=U1X9V5_ANEAE|nr:hypothetical protein HMPREF0083_00590 [Aneurinibacillus aneurinilyticus ATCC 12856]
MAVEKEPAGVFSIHSCATVRLFQSVLLKKCARRSDKAHWRRNTDNRLFKRCFAPRLMNTRKTGCSKRVFASENV